MENKQPQLIVIDKQRQSSICKSLEQLRVGFTVGAWVGPSCTLRAALQPHPAGPPLLPGEVAAAID